MAIPHWPPTAPSWPKVAIFDDIWGDFGVTLELMLGTVGVFFDACRLQEPKKRARQALRTRAAFFIDFGVCPKVPRRVLAAAGALFLLWRPVAKNVDFWLHFGIILGATSSTMLTLESP